MLQSQLQRHAQSRKSITVALAHRQQEVLEAHRPRFKVIAKGIGALGLGFRNRRATR